MNVRNVLMLSDLQCSWSFNKSHKYKIWSKSFQRDAELSHADRRSDVTQLVVIFPQIAVRPRRGTVWGLVKAPWIDPREKDWWQPKHVVDMKTCWFMRTFIRVPDMFVIR